MAHWKAKKMLEYKAAWKGVTIVALTKSETYGSSSVCSACGEKLYNPEKGDGKHARMLWCQKCEAWMDRDVNAVLNLSTRGRSRFARSLSQSETEEEGRLQQADPASTPVEDKGQADEAMKGSGTKTLILRVDAGKLIRMREQKS